MCQNVLFGGDWETGKEEKTMKPGVLTHQVCIWSIWSLPSLLSQPSSATVQLFHALHFSKEDAFCIGRTLAKCSSLQCRAQDRSNYTESLKLDTSACCSFEQQAHYLIAFITLHFIPIWDHISFNSLSHANQDKMLARPQRDVPAVLPALLLLGVQSLPHCLLLCNHIKFQLPSKTLQCLPAADKVKARKQWP